MTFLHLSINFFTAIPDLIEEYNMVFGKEGTSAFLNQILKTANTANYLYNDDFTNYL